MDGRPVAATIIPFLALAGVLVAGGIVVAAQGTTGRPDLVRRAKEWGTAVAHRDVRTAGSMLSPRDRREPQAMLRLGELIERYGGGEIRLRGVKKHPKSLWTTYQVLLPDHDRFSPGRVGALAGIGVDWVREADGIWYVELGEP